MKLGNLKIGKRLGIGFGVIIGIFGLFMLMGIFSLTSINRDSRQIKEESLPFAILAEEMAFDVVQVQQFLTDVSATHEPEGYKGAEKAAGGFLSGVAKYEEMYRRENDAKSLKFMEELRKEFDGYYDLGRKMANAYVTEGIESGNAIMKDFDKISVSLTSRVMEFKDAQVKEASGLTAAMAASAQWMKIAIISASLVALLIALVVSTYITRSITSRLREAVSMTEKVARGDLTMSAIAVSSDETGQVLKSIQCMVENLRNIVSETVSISACIASAAAQLRTTSEEIATGAEQVASQVTTVATASEQMSSTSSDIARNCVLVADASHCTTESATTGARVVNESITGISLIADRVRQTSKTVEALGSRSVQIGEIIGTIEDIADQTNLLALNAAIEAARAGEQGRGFAVVADEVRALAERTTKATREIGTMIKAIQRETGEAVMAMEEGVTEVEKGASSSRKSGDALEDIIRRISEVSMQISQIATAAEEQTTTTGEVTMNIQQITQVVCQAAIGAEQTASAASDLNSQAQKLQGLVGQFKLA